MDNNIHYSPQALDDLKEIWSYIHFVYFTVDKASGMTSMKEVVPNLGVESDAGEFSLYDYLNESD